MILNDIILYDEKQGDFTWKLNRGPIKAGSKAGHIRGDGYVIVCINKKGYYGHILAWFLTYGYWPDFEIDHVDNNRSNNRLSNLREATVTQNKGNVGILPSNTSGFKGVSFDASRSRYRAQIYINGTRKRLGDFKDPIQAAMSYDEYAIRHWGQFAKTNKSMGLY